MSADGKVVYKQDGPIARVFFDDPSAHNALTSKMWRDLGTICRGIATDKSVRAVVLRGVGGKAFISGTDITKFSAFETGADGLAYESGIDEFIGSVDDMPQPTIAVVDGWAVGGGLNIACGCDFRIMTPDARFGSPLGRTIGNCLSAKSYARIASIVGIPAAKRMLLLGEFLTAPELLASGAIYSMVERADLDAAAEALVQKAMENAPLTTKASKESMRRIVYAGLPDVDDLVREVYGSNDFKLGVRTFLEKKKVKPKWSGS